LSAIEIAQQMLKHVDAYRADDERQVPPAVAAKSARPRPKARAILVLPLQPYARKRLIRCLLVRRG
jgi:hypothetical protein